MSTDRGAGSGERTVEDAHVLVLPTTLGRPTLSWTDSAGRHALPIAGRVLAGSAEEAGLVVRDPTVSRLHAELSLENGALWIRDLGSRNGTYVEGVQVVHARVPPRARLRFGAATLSVETQVTEATKEVYAEESFGGLVGGSQRMRQLFARLARVSPTETNVLIQGETGTGKELVARAIHDASPRAAGPFVVVDCAAIPETLIESQLFGHAKGAFTGAMTTRVGDIEAAQGGTVFLDEIGELPLAMQPKLLRVLESRTVRRVGETQTRNVDVRFLSATHRNLGSMVNAGAFREDLYFRLSVVPITIAPLRERLDDIPLLVQRFLPKSARGSVSPDLLHELATRPWLGNIRELRNFVERALAMGLREALAVPAHEGPSTEGPPAPGEAVSYEQPLREFREQWIDAGEREYLTRLLERHGRDVPAAAEAAGVNRTYVYRLMRKHRL